jgi:hypothetical protein
MKAILSPKGGPQCSSAALWLQGSQDSRQQIKMDALWADKTLW